MTTKTEVTMELNEPKHRRQAACPVVGRAREMNFPGPVKPEDMNPRSLALGFTLLDFLFYLIMIV